MRRPARPVRRRPRVTPQWAFLPTGCQLHGVDGCARRDTYEQLGTAKCPLCGWPLVARLSRQGPYFSCRCPQRKAA